MIISRALSAVEWMVNPSLLEMDIFILFRIKNIHLAKNIKHNCHSLKKYEDKDVSNSQLNLAEYHILGLRFFFLELRITNYDLFDLYLFSFKLIFIN